MIQIKLFSFCGETLIFDRKKKLRKVKALYQGYKWLQISCVGETGGKRQYLPQADMLLSVFSPRPPLCDVVSSDLKTSCLFVVLTVILVCLLRFSGKWNGCLYCFSFPKPTLYSEMFPFRIDMDVGRGN